MSDPTILLCDDETHLREMVAEYLETRGFAVLEAENPARMRATLAEHRPDLIILDIRMPGEDGLTALKTLRADHNTPVIMLTASAGTVDRVVGLELGADDYLGKPVDLRELEARIKAVLRRPPPRVSESPPTATHPASGEGIIAFGGGYALDLDAARLIAPDGSEVAITAMDYTLLQYFANNRGRVLTRDQILEHTNVRGSDPFDRSIDLRISRLRKKIEANPARPEVIRTVRGLGYIFDGTP